MAPSTRLPIQDDRSGPLMLRLWREHVRQHRGRLLAILEQRGWKGWTRFERSVVE